MPAQTIIKHRRDTASNWASTNPVLAAGELGFVTSGTAVVDGNTVDVTGYSKVGDGTTAWGSLAWQNKTGPQGPTGAAGTNGTNGTNGAAASVTVGTVTTGTPGSSATVTNGGTTSAAVLNFSIPAGSTGSTGATGPTGPAGTSYTGPKITVSSSAPTGPSAGDIWIKA